MLEELGENSPSANPYAHFRCCCATFHTKPHAQLAGVLSFSLFICMVVISLYTLGSFSIFYIAMGVIVYSFLMRAVFNAHAEKVGVLAYLVFESIQIGFLAALIMYFMMPVFVDRAVECPKRSYEKYDDCVQRSRREEIESRAALIQLLICLTLLTVTKFYFTRVFARFYKYLLWAEQKGNSVHAQYWNARGVRINVDDVFAVGPNGAPPHVVWSNSGNGYLLNLGSLPTLPSYSQIVGPNDGHRKPSADLSTTARAVSAAPPTWDGEVSAARTAPPTYTLPPSLTTTPHTQPATTQQTQQQQQRNELITGIAPGQHTATVFDQQIPIGVHQAAHRSGQADSATSDEHSPPATTQHNEPQHREVTEQHILPEELHNPASNLRAVDFDDEEGGQIRTAETIQHTQRVTESTQQSAESTQHTPTPLVVESSGPREPTNLG